MSVLCAMHAWAAKVHPPSSMTTNQPPFTMGAARVATGPIEESRPFRSRSIHHLSSLATARLAELEAEDNGGRNQRQRQPAATQVISHMISHNWLYHNYIANYLISHNCEITVFYMISRMISRVTRFYGFLGHVMYVHEDYSPLAHE